MFTVNELVGFCLNVFLTEAQLQLPKFFALKPYLKGKYGDDASASILIVNKTLFHSDEHLRQQTAEFVVALSKKIILR